MAEYIERERIALGVLGLTIVDPMVAQYADAVLLQIQQAPAADVVEVVRCKDCERRSKSADLTDTVWCPWLQQQMQKTDFCSYGKRRDNDAND